MESKKIETICKFDFITFKGEEYYRCLIKNQPLHKQLNGQHVDGKSCRDVTFLEFDNCEMEDFKGLSNVFPNLKVLDIKRWSAEEICKEQIEEFKNLEIFHCKWSDIKLLRGDLFEGFNQLKRIDFWHNELEVIQPTILDGLTKLEFVNFGRPDNIFQFSIYEGNHTTGTLEEFKKQLHDNFEDTLREEFRQINDQRKELEEELEQEKLKITELTKKLAQMEQEKLEQAEMIENLQKDNEKLIQENHQLIELELNLKEKLEQEKKINEKFTQRLEKGILSDVIDLIQDESARDFNIVIKDHEFPVHKCILQARSPTLAEILRNNPEAQNINLTDIDVDVFEKIFQFLYADELPSDNEVNYLKLFRAAGVLKIEDLKNFAGVKACNSIRKENAVEVLKLSSKYEHEELKNCAFDQIKKFYPKIKFDNNWIRDIKKILGAIEKKRASRIPVRISLRK
ncbi:hypothetical protein ACKWTF_000995 [Chironomus riparius]